ncbi:MULTISPECIES: mucin-binding protein [Lactiplantibacillus]|uniref:mucin-binding protein n=1 Tax=Lactiplantibacillus TaxID=2767842 RepID=UPI001C2000FF|nr:MULTISPECIES: hypothetical protein [Lactiplantibacillus]MBU7447259.1 hypothetical protein [Lactiplantibacillus sp. 7.2.4]MBU7479321.1 hypothetical protein [Lactiplantibacillus pentosus]MBU7503254.1 hypothetical protein [Lactiplantibacillus pentosus]MDY1546182.1 hypothetical protein [Lactiplantibacillus pentosus]
MISDDSVTTQVQSTERTITRTIHYLDREDLQPITGVKSVTQRVTYDLLTVVASDGTLLGYDTDGDGQVDTCRQDQAWLLVGSAPWFSSVRSPDLSQQDYAAPDLKVVPQQMVVNADDQDVTVNVYYRSATKTIPSYRTKRRTVSYVDRWTHRSVAPEVQQLVVYRQMMIVEKRTGTILGYDLNDDGQVDTGLPDQAWLRVGRDHFDSVISPDLTNAGYTKPNISALTSQVVTVKTPQMATHTVSYGHQRLTISPDHPGIPGQPVDKRYPKLTYPIRSDRTHLMRSISRTINYVDSEGATVADQVYQSTSFQRSAQIDLVTGQLTYQAWHAIDTDTMPAVTSPVIAGKVPDVDRVAALTVNPATQSQQVTVTYHQVPDDSEPASTNHLSTPGDSDSEAKVGVKTPLTNEIIDEQHVNQKSLDPRHNDQHHPAESAPVQQHETSVASTENSDADQQSPAADTHQSAGIGWVNAPLPPAGKSSKSSYSAGTLGVCPNQDANHRSRTLYASIKRVQRWLRR